MKKICVVTGSRAEYGLLRWVIKDIKASKFLKLQLMVTGSHLNNMHGNTIKEIKIDGFKINSKIKILSKNDSEIGIANSIGLGIRQFTEKLTKLKPTYVLILGDRYEIFSVAIACTILRIPIIHLHGGEKTEGAIDEALRHSITKMSQLHFVASNEYRNRVIQLGEKPKNVFNVGGFGVDSLFRTKLLSKKKLEKELNFKFLKKNLLVTFHPETLESKKTNIKNFSNLLISISNLQNTKLIFTLPNADTDNNIIKKKIIQFCKKYKNAIYFKSLGNQKYLSCLRYVDAIVGNSSSGLAEVPSFKKATINIGDRQKGRLKAKSVIDCKPNIKSLRLALGRIYSSTFQNNLKNVINPHGKEGASKKLVKILEKKNSIDLVKKSFYDLKF